LADNENEKLDSKHIYNTKFCNYMIYEKIPAGIKLISIVNYIFAVMCFPIFIMFFLKDETGTFILSKFLVNVTDDIYLFVSIAMIFAFFFFFNMGKGLWNGKVWARYIQIIISFIGLILALYFTYIGQLFAILGIMLFGIIVLYLIFNNNVVDAFY